MQSLASTHADPPRYFMASSVFVCATRRGAVFLDLTHNRYFGLGCSDALTLSRHVHEFPKSDYWNDSSTSEASTNSLLESFLTAGILTSRAPDAREVVSTQVHLHGALVSIGDEIVRRMPVRVRHIVAFSFFLAWSAVALRWLPLRSVARKVYRRRSAAIARGYRFDLSRTSELVYVFRAIRPFFFSADGHCLLHALTLVNFLGHYHEFPVWAFGVTSDPWTAHSWVQQDSFLLDSSPDKVCHLDFILGI
jgi:hypothetical protein